MSEWSKNHRVFSLYMHDYTGNHRGVFSGLIGETPPLKPANKGEVVRDLTTRYIQAIADFDDTTKHQTAFFECLVAALRKQHKAPGGKYKDYKANNFIGGDPYN